MKSPQDHSVSVIVPAWNEAKGLSDVLIGIRQMISTGDELLLVDDGSTDATAARASQAGARVVSHPERRGKGAALCTGAQHVQGQILVFMDADGQDDPHDIPKLLAPILQGDADLVVGSRVLGLKERLPAGGRMERGVQALAGWGRHLLALPVSDPLSSFWGIRRSLWESHVNPSDGDQVLNRLLVSAVEAGAAICEVSVYRYERAHGHKEHHHRSGSLATLSRLLASRHRRQG